MIKQILSSHCPWTADREPGTDMVFSSNNPKCELQKEISIGDQVCHTELPEKFNNFLKNLERGRLIL